MSDYMDPTYQSFCSSAIILDYSIQRKITDKTGKHSLLESVYQYPQIALAEYHSSFQKINQSIEKEVLQRFYKNYNSMLLQIQDFINPAILNENQNTNPWLPLTASMTYQVAYNKNGMLSIVFQEFLWFGGAHPSTEQLSFTYDLCSGKELEAKDILGLNETQIKEQIANGFAKQYEKSPEKFFPEDIERLKKLNFSYRFYLTDQGVVTYFNPYEIGPYVSGILSELIPIARIV